MMFLTRHAARLVVLIQILTPLLQGRIAVEPWKFNANLIENPGFEDGQGDRPSGWEVSGDASLVSDEIHSGEKALRVRSQGNSAVAASAWFTVPGHSLVRVSAWMKARGVVGSSVSDKLRLTLYAYKGDRSTEIEHYNFMMTEGSFGWKKIQGDVIVPAEAHSMRLLAQLTQSNGVFWIDDVSAVVAQVIPHLDFSAINQPVLLPQPRRMKVQATTLPIGKLVLLSQGFDKRHLDSMTRFLGETSIPHAVISSIFAIRPADTVVVSGDRTHPAVGKRFTAVFPDGNWDDLGQQGYFLSVEKGERKNTVFIGANSEQGKYYGLQTLKQLLKKSTLRIYQVDILDRPSLDRRGVAIGKQWFSKPKALFKRLSEFKLNFAWTQGTYVNSKFWFKWREPLTEAEQAEVREYLEAAQDHFIEVYLSIGPRGQDASQPTYFSSDTEIDFAVAKMDELYRLGLRNFGLSFDDVRYYEQDRLYGPDIEFFDGNIGAAHAYFINQVYQRLKRDHPDAKMMVVPMEYTYLGNKGDADEGYLAVMGKLHPDIQLYSSIEFREDAQEAIRISGRPHMVWDNHWSEFYIGKAPKYVVPLDRPANLNNTNIFGYSFLPMIPEWEDASLVSWSTAASYAWAPDRYDAYEVFQLAAWKYVKPAGPILPLAVSFNHNFRRFQAAKE